ncbi:hypothetical protein B0H63DRAFT_451356 [Podospora didyma]|uniref:Uncharacterized protein n=1 Tax=Podospora didyma TaxID=330526 RepID=A0AAE0KJ67_9PEZI|nr:hypothetical protein B0H63DRAFT_451356 [Podospora didyma]
MTRKPLAIIFNVIHYRLDDIDDPLDPDIVLRVAVASDKYDLTSSLKHCVKSWLDCAKISDPHKICQLAIAPAWFQNEKGFRYATLALLLSHGRRYLGLGHMDKMPVVMMEERRSQLRLNLISRVLRIAVECIEHWDRNYRGCDSSTCGYIKCCSADYITHLTGARVHYIGPGYSDRQFPNRDHTKMDPIRLSDISLNDVIKSFNVKGLSTGLGNGCSGCKRKHFAADWPDFNELVRKSPSEFRAQVVGLCLHCVCEGEEHHEEHVGGA